MLVDTLLTFFAIRFGWRYPLARPLRHRLLRDRRPDVLFLPRC